jgi:iron complex transport system substrate-binding protein
MKFTVLLSVLALVALAACGPRAGAPAESGAPRIVSLDFCADQYVLKFADRDAVAALSPDAEKSESYMREAAAGLPKVRSRAEDVLVLRPDIVVRSYGGGPKATDFFERVGVKVVQIPYANDIAAIRQSVLEVSAALGAAAQGRRLVAEMDARIAALSRDAAMGTALYLTSKGAVAGGGTIIDSIFHAAGVQNFQSAPGWTTAPLERLAYEAPDMIAAGFFETSDLHSDLWSPARHPVAQRRLAALRVVDIPGAWTACAGWFVLDAAEAIHAAATQTQERAP